MCNRLGKMCNRGHACQSHLVRRRALHCLDLDSISVRSSLGDWWHVPVRGGAQGNRFLASVFGATVDQDAREVTTHDTSAAQHNEGSNSKNGETAAVQNIGSGRWVAVSQRKVLTKENFDEFCFGLVLQFRSLGKAREEGASCTKWTS